MVTAKLYLYGAIALVLLAIAGGLYAKGQLDARHAVELRTLKDSIKVLEAEAERERAARVADAIQAKIDREDHDADELEAKRLQDELPDPDSLCFDAGSADRLRDLIGN